MHCLFLQGDIQTGKSTLLLNNLKPHLYNIGGFYVQRMLDGGSNRAFCLKRADDQPLTLTAPYDPANKAIFIEKTADGWQQYPKVFTKIGISLLDASMLTQKKMVLMDEIGGIEILSPDFKTALYKVLGGQVPCIGVIKSFRNKAKMQDKLSLENNYEKLYQNLFTDITQSFDGKIITMTMENKEYVQNEIKNFLKANF